MRIETKCVRGDVSDYLKFGWEHTEDRQVHFSRMLITEHVLARDMDMENYLLVRTYEAKYFSLKKEMLSYEPMEPAISILLFLLLVLPLVLYVAYKSHQKDKIDAHNANLQKQMDEILKKVAALL